MYFFAAAPLPIPHERMVSGRCRSQPALTEDGVGLGRVPSNARQQMHTLTFAAAAATVAVGDVVLAAEVGGTEIDERARAPVTSYNCNASARHFRRIRHNNVPGSGADILRLHVGDRPLFRRSRHSRESRRVQRARRGLKSRAPLGLRGFPLPICRPAMLTDTLAIDA